MVPLQALQLFPAIMIVPMMQISWTLFSILSGGIYFQEYRTMSLSRGCGYGLGVGVSGSPTTLFIAPAAKLIQKFSCSKLRGNRVTKD